MERTILVPTDLHIGSLNALKSCLAENTRGKVRVILMYAMHTPDGISDLLFYSPRKVMKERIHPAFNEALSVLRNRFEQQLTNLDIVPYHGVTQAAFDQFVKARCVDEIHISTSYDLLPTERMIDPLPFIRKADVRVVEHDKSNARATEKRPVLDHLQLLFER